MGTIYETSDGKQFNESDNAMASHQAREHQEKLDRASSSSSGTSSSNTNAGVNSIENFTKSLDMLSNNNDRAMIYILRAQEYYKLKQYHNAIEDCKKAIELNPAKEETAKEIMAQCQKFAN